MVATRAWGSRAAAAVLQPAAHARRNPTSSQTRILLGISPVRGCAAGRGEHGAAAGAQLLRRAGVVLRAQGGARAADLEHGRSERQVVRVGGAGAHVDAAGAAARAP